MLRLFIFCLFFILPSAALAETPAPNIGSHYSSLIPKKPIFTAAEVAIHTIKFNNWLNANYEKLPQDRIPKMREHLYYLIDSHIKGTYPSTSEKLPLEHDAILAMLFSWAEKLGVFGASQVLSLIHI